MGLFLVFNISSASALSVNFNSDESIGLEHRQGDGVVGFTINEDKLLFTMGVVKKLKHVNVGALIEIGRHDLKREFSGNVTTTTTTKRR